MVILSHKFFLTPKKAHFLCGTMYRPCEFRMEIDIHRKVLAMNQLNHIHSSENQTSTTNPRLALRLVRRESYLIGQASVRCSLWRMQGDGHDSLEPTFAVGMSLSKLSGVTVRRLYPIGKIFAEADAFFDVLVRNRVSPCTLGDILEDRRDKGGLPPSVKA